MPKLPDSPPWLKPGLLSLGEVARWDGVSTKTMGHQATTGLQKLTGGFLVVYRKT